MRVIILLVLLALAICHTIGKDPVEEAAKEIRARAEQYLASQN